MENQQINIKELSEEKLKALIFDASEIISLQDRNIQALRQELVFRLQNATKTIVDATEPTAQ
jgi:hypothetical protein